MLATIHLPQRLTEEELWRITEDNPGWQVELDSDGTLLMSANSAINSPKNVELVVQLAAFAKIAGGKAFGPDAGFRMPDNAIFSPDGAWIQQDRWNALTPSQQDSYAPIVPDICVELLSKTDNPATLKKKLLRFRGYGAACVVLIDPYKREVWTDGEAPAGFALDYERIFDA